MKFNPFDAENPMSIREALKVAAVVAFCTWILSCLASATYTTASADWAAFAFDCVIQYAAAFAGSFLGLTGLEVYTLTTKSKERS